MTPVAVSLRYRRLKQLAKLAGLASCELHYSAQVPVLQSKAPLEQASAQSPDRQGDASVPEDESNRPHAPDPVRGAAWWVP